MKKLLTLIYVIIFSALIFSTDIYAAENASHRLYLDITFKELIYTLSYKAVSKVVKRALVFCKVCT